MKVSPWPWYFDPPILAGSDFFDSLVGLNIMNLRSGFEIDDPALVIPWGIKEEELLRLGGTEGLRQVTTGYYTASCKVLGGLSVEVGFHFEPRAKGRLAEIEIFRKFPKPMTESFEEFQKHLEATFGKPTASSPGTEGFPHFEWRVPGGRVSHYVFDRFGPEEHVRIKHK